MSLKIRVVENQEDVDACLDLRWRVFVEEQGVPEADERDGEDDHCGHVLVEDAGIPVGAARFRLVEDHAKIQRVCVPASHRGRGIGADIIRFIVAEVSTRTDVRAVKLGAQSQALEFYRKLGFQDDGDEFLDAGIPHKTMVLTLGER